ncbi:hypothetical protein Q9299_09270 [Gemmobacter fulvus]|uniref:hypothetical protein n=1 Tax=Gemmobacter fulvus TaxID=2840474 RepID=UPI0027966EE1|nr:hypothetical protein [Gemmobacter fulvus]MDQ1848474.1 hypothetical protein [Gemmobacter fulvus]
MALNLTRRLKLSSLDHGELDCFLNSLITDSTRERRIFGEGSIDCFGDQIRTTRAKSGTFTKIEWCDARDKPGADAFIRDLSEAMSAAPATIMRRVIFVPRPFLGALRIDNGFQLVELPPSSPRPQITYADHPCLLEFLVNPSANKAVTEYRTEQEFTRLLAFLAVILGPGIKGPPLPTKHWVLVQDDNGSHTSVFAQQGYWHEELWPDRDKHGFSHHDCGPVPRLPEQRFYTDPLPFDAFPVPDSLENSWRAFACLDPKETARFLRAAYWYRASHNLISVSASLSFSAYVFAIEALCGRMPDGEKCETCLRPRENSATRSFTEFLDRYGGVPAGEAPEWWSKAKDWFYDKRSKIVHGSDLLRADSEAAHLVFSHLHSDDVHMRRLLARFCQAALINWLRAPDRAHICVVK